MVKTYPGRMAFRLLRSRWLGTQQLITAERIQFGHGGKEKAAGRLAACIAPRRTYNSSSVKSIAEKVLGSEVSFRLASALWVGVGATLLYYAWRRGKKGSQTEGDQGQRGRSPQGSRFSQKVVLITGGAGDIGSATAQAFAREGATVVLVDLPRTQKDLEEKCTQLKSMGASDSFCISADMTSGEEVETMVKRVIEKTGRIDCCFNNAGIQGELLPLHEQSDNEFLKVLQVNAYGVFLCMKHVAKAMMSQEGAGVIVNTASLAGLRGPPNMMAYAASKFAVVGMTQTAAKDLSRYGIRVCAIAPGLLEGKLWSSQVKGQTECLRRLQGKEGVASEEELKQTEVRMIEGTPMKRLGKLSEVANVTLFLCSDEASYLTGNIVPIDGGRV